MKRQTQVPGVRRWFGDDFLELQSETLSAIDAFAGAYNKPCVVSGCTVSGGSVAKGFVVLSTQNEGLKIMPFDGATIATPCYLTAVKTPVNSVYADGVARLSAYQYKAVASTATPAAGVSFVKIEANGKCDRLPDVMQDALHRMVSDSEKSTWNAKETPTGAQTKATQAKNDALEAANTYIGQTRREARDYTDARETAVREFVGVVETGLHRITESLTTTKADKTEVALKANKQETFAKLPMVQGAYAPDSYLKQCAMWYQNTGNSDHRGWYMNFGEGSDFYRLQFTGDRSQNLGISLYAGSISGDVGSSYDGAEVLHTGNTTQTVIAGMVNGTAYDPYIGRECDITPVGSKYSVMHQLNTDRYIVNITPINPSVRSFSVIKKESNYFEVQFSSATPFEIQILKY